uniref:O-acetylhomoserine aminocarboxypropyltransferase n=1 Tax=Zooxanthella nutricula TaxID=1333877 RepID=A0A7S2VM00_9DINO
MAGKELRGRCPADAGFSTKCLYAGQQPDPTTGARTTPINMSTAFVFQDSEQAAARFALGEFGPIYTRITNPTSDAVEQKIAALEGGSAAVATSCGHAAQLLAFSNLMQPGDHIVATDKLYGGTFTQFGRQFKQFGWEVTFCGYEDFDGIKGAITPRTKAVYCESIANPGGLVLDLEKLASIAHEHGLPLIVDNTTATPYLVRPFEHGADVIVHSATKGLGGHGNAMGGFVVEKGDFDWARSGKFPVLSEPCESYHGVKLYETFGKDGPVAESMGTKGKCGMAFAIAARTLGLRDMGMCISPFNAFLISMGMETLPLRMQKHCDNTLEVARFLEKHPKVKWVRYAGLGGSNFALHQKYCPKGAGALFTFGLKGGYEAGKALVDSVQMISLVANLGDSRTLIAHPASMMHSQLSEEQRQAAGAETETIRLSVGLEDAKDIIDDLRQALDATPQAAL